MATTMSMTWAGTSVVALLTDSASVGANTFTTAASFCVGSTNVLTATADTYVDEDNPSSNYGTTTSLKLWGDGGHLKRFYVNFTLPALPAGCSVTSATLTLTRSSSVTNGTLAAYRTATSWTETGLDWSPQPATAGAAATASSAATTSFTVTSQVAAMYPSSAFGFVVKANNEDSDTEQVFYSRTGATPPTLTVVIG
jgi:hypothetical protein